MYSPLYQSLNEIRYVKINGQATVEHVANYLALRHKIEAEAQSSGGGLVTSPQVSPTITVQSTSAFMDNSLFTYPYTLFISSGPGAFKPLAAEATLFEVLATDTNHNPNHDLELYYTYKYDDMFQRRDGPRPKDASLRF